MAITKEYTTNGIDMSERVMIFLIDVPVIKTAIKQASGFAILERVTERWYVTFPYGKVPSKSKNF